MITELTIDSFKVGAIIEFKDGPLAGGLWKGIKKTHFKGYETEWIKFAITKDTKEKGDEVILEFYPNDARHVYCFKIYNSFPASAQPFPPPREIKVEEEDIVYKTLDQELSNFGFEASYTIDGNVNDIKHWEYENESGDRVLQILLEKDFVEIYTGFKVNVSSVNIY